MTYYVPDYRLSGEAADNSDLFVSSFATLAASHAAAARYTSDLPHDTVTARRHDSSPGFPAALRAIETVLHAEGFPTDAPSQFLWCRDSLGKPFVEWSGGVALWAEANGRKSSHLHVSNTHDGGAHVVIAAYCEDLAGIGIDAVWLPRLRRPGKDAAYLQRFARQFMSPEEWAAFEYGSEHPFPEWHGAVSAPGAVRPANSAAPSVSTGAGSLAPPIQDRDEALRLRIAAHFSLMEAASKACGTGLKMGVGMGRSTSLPKQSLGALRVAPDVELLFGPEAKQRLHAIGARRYEACVQANSELLVSVVALYRSRGEKTQNEAGGTGHET